MSRALCLIFLCEESGIAAVSGVAVSPRLQAYFSLISSAVIGVGERMHSLPHADAERESLSIFAYTKATQHVLATQQTPRKMKKPTRKDYMQILDCNHFWRLARHPLSRYAFASRMHRVYTHRTFTRGIDWDGDGIKDMNRSNGWVGNSRTTLITTIWCRYCSVLCKKTHEPDP